MPHQSDEMLILATRLPRELRNRLISHCRDEGRKIEFVVARAIELYLENIDAAKNKAAARNRH